MSNNHLMLGHIMEWFYSGLAGISQADSSVAFKHIKIRPQPVGDITSAKGSFNLPYGLVTTVWKKTAGSFLLKVHIPVNADANVYLPVSNGNVYLNGRQLDALPITKLEGLPIIKISSGDYTFEVK